MKVMLFRKRARDAQIGYRTLLVSNLIVVLITAVLGAVFYSQMRDLLRKRIADENLHALAQGQLLIDAEIQKLEAIVQQLGVNQDLRSLSQIRRPFDPPDHERLIRFTRESAMFPYGTMSPLIAGLYLHIEPGDIVAGPQLALPYETFFKYYISLPGYSAERWREEMVSAYHVMEFRPALDAVIGRIGLRVVPLLHSYGSPEDHPVTLLILMDEKILRSMLGGARSERGGFLAIADARGEILTSDVDTPTGLVELLATRGSVAAEQAGSRNQAYLASQTVSALTGWRFVSGIKMSAIESQLKYIQRTTLLVISIFLFAALLTAVLSAYGTSRPISALVEQTRYLKQELQEQRPFLNSAVLDGLLAGRPTDLGFAAQLFKDAGFSLESPPFLVFIIRFTDPAGRKSAACKEDARSVAKRAVVESLGTPVLFHEFQLDRIAVLISLAQRWGESSAMIPPEYFFGLCERIGGAVAAGIDIGVGGSVDGAESIYVSFEQARTALDYGSPARDRSVFLYRDVPERGDGYVFGFDREQRIFALAKSGQTEALEKEIGLLFEANFEKRSLTAAALRCFLYDLLGTILKIVETTYLTDRASVDDEMHRLAQTIGVNDARRCFDSIASLLRTICEEVEGRKRSHNDDLRLSVEAYLSEHVYDPDLSLKRLAPALGVSEGYLSHFVSEQFGIGFQEYVEGLRLRGAAHMLESTELLVREVARSSGYGSLNSFCRAFKRVHGTNPTDFRALARNRRAAQGPISMIE